MTTNPLPPIDVSNIATCRLDLASAKSKDVVEIHDAFTIAMKTNSVNLGPVPVKKSGWYTITPDMAGNLLMRNRPGANRPLDPGTVLFYAKQMARGDWKATGQPIIIDDKDVLLDAQHRLFACVISGASFKSYVITGVTAQDNLFAYIDASKPRTAATALQTAGHNGVSNIIVPVIRFAEEVKAGVFNRSTGASKLDRMSNAQMLALVDLYPGAKDAARATASDWEDAADYICGNKKRFIVAYVGMIITETHGEDRADEFFDALVVDDGEAKPSDDPIAALRKVIDKDKTAEKPMKKHEMIAALIIAFNAWHMGTVLHRRWMLAVNEDFPTLVGAAAEAETNDEEEAA